MTINWGAVLAFMIPYVLVFIVAYLLGFMGRNGRIDSLQATITKLTAELNGVEIRTSRTEPTEKPVHVAQPRTVRSRPVMQTFGPGHSAARTEPLPDGVQYVAAAEADEPVSDRAYFEMFGQSRVE